MGEASRVPETPKTIQARLRAAGDGFVAEAGL
jgi:hypothetical protein